MNRYKLTGRLKIASERLLSRYPLLGGIVAAWREVPMQNGTIAVGMGESGFELHVNHDFINGLTMDEIVGVLHHEARHVLFGHVLMPPELYPDERAFSIATEVSANQGLPEPLPGEPLRLEDFPELNPDEDTESHYARLADPNARRDRSEGEGLGREDGVGRGNDLGQERNGEAGASTGDQGQASKPGLDDEDAGEDAERNQGRPEERGALSEGDAGNGNRAQNAGRHVGDGQVQTLDDHSLWQSIREQEGFARNLIEGAVAETLSKEPRLPEEELHNAETLRANWGVNPEETLASLAPSRRVRPVDWRKALRQYIGRIPELVPTYARPSRRFPHLTGIVPGVQRRAGKPRVLAVIDTSGSMGEDILSEISAELDWIACRREVFVAECDAAIHRVYRYSGPLQEVQGRGGTDFRPPLEREFLRKHRPDLVIFFTDGCGPAPENAPSVPVLWVLTPGGTKPAEWGAALTME